MGPHASPLLRCPSLHHFLSLRRPRFLTLSLTLTLTLTFTLNFTLHSLSLSLSLTLTFIHSHSHSLLLSSSHTHRLCHSLTRKHFLLLQNIHLFGSGKDQGRWCFTSNAVKTGLTHRVNAAKTEIGDSVKIRLSMRECTCGIRSPAP